ncbi:MAG: glycosyltransferase [Solirubrobacterales bacterium]
MIRPRTPRRRPAATAYVLRWAASELGAEVVSFGCEVEELASVAPTPLGFEHRGVLSRAAVADLLRWADVFVDLSVYQAFGRSGLEAMACGCVPVLPPVGGVGEYARDGVDALLVDAADEQAVISALARLDGDREHLRELAAAGARRAEGWSLERSALSIHAALSTALDPPARGGGGAGVVRPTRTSAPLCRAEGSPGDRSVPRPPAGAHMALRERRERTGDAEPGPPPAIPPPGPAAPPPLRADRADRWTAKRARVLAEPGGAGHINRRIAGPRCCRAGLP